MPAKRKAVAGIQLTREEFFELRARTSAFELATETARRDATARIVQEIQQALAPVKAKQDACFNGLAKKYKFDPAQTFRFDEATCSLIPVNQPSA